MRPAHYRTRDILTARQCEVLQLVARGYTNPQIAQELGITLDGAKFQVSEILSRLDSAVRVPVRRRPFTNG
jgi:DNA-binding NarL/FixJ family response regulator